VVQILSLLREYKNEKRKKVDLFSSKIRKSNFKKIAMGKSKPHLMKTRSV
jgi:hypothetical protein